MYTFSLEARKRSMKPNSMFTRLAAGVFFFIALAAQAAQDFGQCQGMFPGNTPPAVNYPARALCFDAFAVLYSPVSKTPIYVVEKLNRARLTDAQGEQRSDNFYVEARLPYAERADLEDYRGSGYDRGHMAPAADMPNPQAMAQSFSLANMVPQAPVNNRKIWSQVEKATRKYAMRAAGDVYVITGPIFSKDSRMTGDVMVPDYLYKLVYDATTGRAWAHWVANTDSAYMGPPISYQELVARTGIEFIKGLR